MSPWGVGTSPCSQHVIVPVPPTGRSVPQGVLRKEFPLDGGPHLRLQGRGLGSNRHGVSVTVMG